MGSNTFNVGDFVALNWSLEYKRIVKIIKKVNYCLNLIEGERIYRHEKKKKRMDDYTIAQIRKKYLSI